MATKKATAAKAAPTKKPTAKKATSKAAPAKIIATPATLKPIGTKFTKSSLIAHLAQQTGVEPKSVKAVMGCLEATVLASMNKKGIGEFMLPGLLKAVAIKVPAKPKRKGINPFTKEEQWFAAKPATIKVKIRPLAKIKAAVL